MVSIKSIIFVKNFYFEKTVIYFIAGRVALSFFAGRCKKEDD